MARLSMLVAIALVLGGCAHAPRSAHAGGAAEPAALASAIDALAAELLAKTPAAGVSIAVVRHGDTIVAKGYGLADVEHKTPVTSATVFRVGSITKQLTAAAILQLAGAHRLALDDDLHRYLPDYPTRGQTITLRQLLTHTSGIADYEHRAWFQQHMAEHRPRSELVASFAAEPLDFVPGTSWSYSNSGYYLLGLIIERVSGQTWAGYVRDHVIARAGAKGIRECPDEQDYAHAARGYEVAGSARVPAHPIAMEHAYAAGALCATAPALIAWTRALAGGRVVDADAWRAMTTPVTLAGGSHFGYGFGLFVSDFAGHRTIFHGGGVNGFSAALAYYPDDDLHIAVLVNTAGGFADELAEEIARVVLGVPHVAPTEVPLDPAEGAALAGSYQIPVAGVTLIIEVQGGKLVAHKEGDKPGPLLRQPDGSFVVAENGGRFVFHREGGEGGRVTGFTYSVHGVSLDANRLP